MQYELTKEALNFDCEYNPKIRVELNDSRKISILKDESIILS